MKRWQSKCAKQASKASNIPIGAKAQNRHKFELKPPSRAQRRLQESFKEPQPKDEPLWLRVDRLNFEVYKLLSTKAQERKKSRERGL